ncbi:response regulator [Rhodococcus rhodnii]|uniref:Transcriptional regulatory protein n=2 Tax=Rhodococcus rhodnii TaxID=38312 RepID=R7WH64_9NOCA|nr:response regulator [Rhodococcus rhodnii]EOM74421.1 regulator relate [Rhodococcus rhodnii LMG 5362]TXG89130.1 response regulator [Rhodococcus rhodnii]
MIRVLIVDDEPRIADAHRSYLERIPGFTTCGVVHDGHGAMRALSAAAKTAEPIDLVLLDLGLPDVSGLDIAAAMNAVVPNPDVIAITSARDLDVVRTAVARGVALYLLKPFTFAAFRDKLERYRAFRESLPPGRTLSQHDIDRAMAALRTPDVTATTPKGVAAPTLSAVVTRVRESDTPLTAAEVASALGMSRVTARRYLEQLVKDGMLARRPEYGKPGRPVITYVPV